MSTDNTTELIDDNLLFVTCKDLCRVAEIIVHRTVGDIACIGNNNGLCKIDTAASNNTVVHHLMAELKAASLTHSLKLSLLIKLQNRLNVKKTAYNSRGLGDTSSALKVFKCVNA